MQASAVANSTLANSAPERFVVTNVQWRAALGSTAQMTFTVPQHRHALAEAVGQGAAVTADKQVSEEMAPVGISEEVADTRSASSENGTQSA